MKLVKAGLLVLSLVLGATVHGDSNRLLSTDLLKYQAGEVYHMQSKDVERANIEAIRELQATRMNRLVRTQKGVRLNGLNKPWVEKVVESIVYHPVVGRYQSEKYNRQDVKIGFCFGRATYAHIALLKMGVNKDAIRKAWVVGPMDAGGVRWQFHVTTLVKDFETNKWWAVDSFPGKVLEIEDWYRHMKKSDASGKLRIYITSPQKFSVSLGTYSRVQLGLDLPRSKDWYQHYFKDLMTWFQQDDLKSVGLKDLRGYYK